MLYLRSLRLSWFLFIVFSLFCSASVISTILSSSSLICSASVTLLLFPSSVFFTRLLCYSLLIITTGGRATKPVCPNYWSSTLDPSNLACYPCFPWQRPRAALRMDSHSWHRIEGAGAKAGRLISHSTLLWKPHRTKQPSFCFNNAQSLLGQICIKQRHIRRK